MFCAHCGSELQPGARFCNRCGAPVVEAEETPEAGVPESPPPTEPLPSYNPESRVSRQRRARANRVPLYVAIGALAVLVIIGGAVGGWLLHRSSTDTVVETVTTVTTVASTSTTVATTTTGSTMAVLTTVLPSTEELVARVQPNVVLIESRSGVGSGFLVGDEEVMTSAHVVEGSHQVSVQYGNSQRVTGTVTHLNGDRDLALVFVPGFNGEPLELLPLDVLKAGSDCVVIGSPLGLDRSVSRGIVSNPDRDAGGVRLVQIDAPVNPGNSGGPILNNLGQVIGIVTLKIRNTEGMGFGVAYDELRSFLTECRDGYWAYSPGYTSTTQATVYSGASGTWTHAYGWTVVVYSITETEGGFDEAVRRANILLSRGYPAGVLYSSDFRSLNPGYWVTYSGEFDNSTQAAAHARVLRTAGYSECYHREVTR